MQRSLTAKTGLISFGRGLEAKLKIMYFPERIKVRSVKFYIS